MLAAMLPEWAPNAACAEKAPNNAPWAPMFDDDVAHRPDADYTWPAGVSHAINVCRTCPVRLECLTYAVESERRQEAQYWAAELQTVRDGRLYGVFGGVAEPLTYPARNTADPVSACDEWFTAQYGVDIETLDSEGSITA
jgi:hypothetical protein